MKTNRELWEMVVEFAQEELYEELGRDATDEEIEERVSYIMETSIPDYDAAYKDSKLEN